MIRLVGLFKFLKNNYDSDEDLKDLEELVYEDENGFKQFDVREMKCRDKDEIHKLVQLLKVM